jgi:hypothetical protein
MVRDMAKSNPKKPKHADPDQPRRFAAMAKELGVTQDDGALDRALKKIGATRTSKGKTP